MIPATLLEARGVSMRYQKRGARGEFVQALQSVSVEVRAGEAVGIVGESGSGKTTLSRLLLGIERPTEGLVLFRGTPLMRLDPAAVRSYRHSVSAVFQNPYSSLDPRMRVWEIVTEQLAIEGRHAGNERHARATELLGMVGLPDSYSHRYPHQLSGGQRQRVAIARALASDPDVIVLDEPISSLDVSVRAQILNLLLDLQDRLGLAYVFIAHDLGIVEHLCQRVVVMYRGRVVERGVSVFARPSHPYTAALTTASYLSDVRLDSAGRITERGAGPDARGCAYYSRCPIGTAHCEAQRPGEIAIEPDHHALCHFPMNTGEPASISRSGETAGAPR